MEKVKPTNYADSGVDIDAGNKLVENIRPFIKATHRTEVLGNFGGFGSAFRLPSNYKKPVLISATDGVGTKLRLAISKKKYGSIGIDLVAMCANDLIVNGAEPLFFLDYYASGKLDVEVASSVIEGIAKGCREAQCALIGGETAEMPGIYASDDFDLAGFCVGIVEEDEMITGSLVQQGDILLGLPSSGVHSNGFSLVRSIINQVGEVDEGIVSELLLPTTIYVKSIRSLLKQVRPKSISHITGGGLIENIPRVLPSTMAVEIDMHAWERPAIFKWIQEKGQVEELEMRRVFNCGIGMVVIIDPNDYALAFDTLHACGESPVKMGKVIKNTNLDSQVQFNG